MAPLMGHCKPRGPERLLDHLIGNSGVIPRIHAPMPVKCQGSDSKYPPAEPGALVLEPLKAAYPCRSIQASLHSVNASPSADRHSLVSYGTCYLQPRLGALQSPSSYIDEAPAEEETRRRSTMGE